jgi:23S rRNA maturation mini-RNase III
MNETDWASLAQVAGVFAGAAVFEAIRRYRSWKKLTAKKSKLHSHKGKKKKHASVGRDKTRPPSV